MIRSKFGQRLFGLGLLVICGAFTAYVWQTALTEGYYYRTTAILPPSLAVAGFGLLFFPLDMDALCREHGVERIDSFFQFPTIWKVWVFVSLAVGLCNWYALSQQ